MAVCSFCNNPLRPGAGLMYVLRDGVIFSFCSSKCKKNQLKLKREGRLTRWTSKGLVLESQKSEEQKKESALAKEIEQKLKEKEEKKKEQKR